MLLETVGWPCFWWSDSLTGFKFSSSLESKQEKQPISLNQIKILLFPKNKETKEKNQFIHTQSTVHIPISIYASRRHTKQKQVNPKKIKTSSWDRPNSDDWKRERSFGSETEPALCSASWTLVVYTIQMQYAYNNPCHSETVRL